MHVLSLFRLIFIDSFFSFSLYIFWDRMGWGLGSSFSGFPLFKVTSLKSTINALQNKHYIDSTRVQTSRKACWSSGVRTATDSAYLLASCSCCRQQSDVVLPNQREWYGEAEICSSAVRILLYNKRHKTIPCDLIKKFTICAESHHINFRKRMRCRISGVKLNTPS